jgi:hypothetical protein
MAVQISLENDEAIVLFELLASGRFSEAVETPERNALWALESLLQKQLVEPLSSDYSALLARARASLVDRYGN